MDDPPAQPGTALRRLLLRPLWTETEEHRRRRRCRLALALPTATLAGVVWGVFSAAELGIDPAFGWTVLSVVAFLLLVWAEEHLRPLAAELGHRTGVGSGGGILWDLVLVGGGGFLLIDVLGAPVVPAVTTALVLGGGWAWLVERVLCGGAVEGVGRLLSPLHRTPIRRRDEHSLGEALAARGELEAAMDYYRSRIRDDPTDPLPYLRLAHHLAAEAGRRGEARAVLRRALEESRLDEDGVGFVERRLLELRPPDRDEPPG